MPLELRRATLEDRKRVLEISSQIWEGHDYVPDVFDQWVTDSMGEFVVAVSDGLVIAFARRGWLFPGHAWLQGIRTDPTHRGKGAAKAITEHFIAAARAESAETIGLSTYIDNEASIHIVERQGFRRVASFVYLEGTPTLAEGDGNVELTCVSQREAQRFIAESNWHEVSCGYLPCDWTIYPFDRAPDVALAAAQYRVGILGRGGLRSLLCARPSQAVAGSHFVSFLDGEPSDFLPLLRHTVEALGSAGFEAMVPKRGGQEAAALGALLELGLVPWNDGREDTYAYEMDLVTDRG